MWEIVTIAAFHEQQYPMSFYHTHPCLANSITHMWTQRKHLTSKKTWKCLFLTKKIFRFFPPNDWMENDGRRCSLIRPIDPVPGRRASDRILVLSDGRIVEDGDPAVPRGLIVWMLWFNFCWRCNHLKRKGFENEGKPLGEKKVETKLPVFCLVQNSDFFSKFHPRLQGDFLKKILNWISKSIDWILKCFANFLSRNEQRGFRLQIRHTWTGFAGAWGTIVQKCPQSLFVWEKIVRA